MTLCECGCGEEVNPGNRFIHGHNQRGKSHTPEHCTRIAKSLTGVPHTPERCGANRLKLIEYYSDQAKRDEMSEILTNSAAAKAAADARRGVSLPPEWVAAIQKAAKNSDAVKARIEAQRGVPKSPEHCAAIKKGIKNSDAAKASHDARIGVPLSPEHYAACEQNWENMRGGNDIVKHHHIYDHSDLSKYTIEMARSQHAILHRQMRDLNIQVPHINTGHENIEELELMEYINKIETTAEGLEAQHEPR